MYGGRRTRAIDRKRRYIFREKHVNNNLYQLLSRKMFSIRKLSECVVRLVCSIPAANVIYSFPHKHLPSQQHQQATRQQITMSFRQFYRYAVCCRSTMVFELHTYVYTGFGCLLLFVVEKQKINSCGIQNTRRYNFFFFSIRKERALYLIFL